MAVRRLLVYATIAVCYILVAAASRAPRVRRQAVFTIISNESIPCATASSLYGPNAEIVDLSDEEKLEVLRMNGGQYMQRYMARTKEQAAKNFVNLLPLPKVFETQIKRSRKSGDLSPVKEQEVVDYMMNHVYNGFGESDEERSGSPAENNAGSKGHTKRLSFREMLDAIRQESDIQKRYRDWRVWTDQDETYRGFPLRFPEMVGMPRTRRTGDGSSTLNYCLYRGDVTADGNHLRLCTVCSSTTSFGSDMWPEFVNEATCSDTDNGCLFTDTTANASCQQVMMSLMMLQKNNNQCILVLRDGQQVVAYEWVTVYRDIGVACECNVKEDSYFVIFV